MSLGVIPNNHDSLLKLFKKLQKPGRELRLCYESGPCGYENHRNLKGRGISCLIAATSLIPAKAGDRVKTDRRDAKNLARLFRSGELIVVWVPGEAQEALRNMVRSREDAVRDLQRKRHQLVAKGGSFIIVIA